MFSLCHFCLLEGSLLFFLSFFDPIGKRRLIMLKLDRDKLLRRFLLEGFGDFGVLGFLLIWLVEIFDYGQNILMEFFELFFLELILAGIRVASVRILIFQFFLIFDVLKQIL